MLRRLVEVSLDHAGIVLTLAAALLGYGLFVAGHARLDVFPEFAPPQVVVLTEAPGLSPEEVEVLVTTPVERAVSGAGGLEALRSRSITGLSVVTATFRASTEILRARQVVAERLASVTGHLPQGVEAPTMMPLTSATSTVLVLGLVSERLSPTELRTFAEWTVRPQLLGTPGVANVQVFGGEVKQLQIQLRPERLVAYGLAMDDVLRAARAATGVRGAGFVDTGPQRIVLRTEGQALTAPELAQVVIGSHDGLSVRLGDVARVVTAGAPKIGDASVMGRPGIVLNVLAQYGANTTEVTERLDRTLASLRPVLARTGIELYPALFRPATFISTAIGNVRTALLVGGVLVALVLFLFLLDLRTAFISFTAIPLSLLAAVVVLDAAGVSLNTLSLGGLAIAVGLVVDDAIIDVENVWRRLRAGPPSPLRASATMVRDGVLEVRGPVVYATLVVALIFLPVVTLPGVEGRLFAPLAIAAILANLASLAVAVTVTPALCLVLLARHRVTREPRTVAWLRRRHRGALEWLAARPGLALGGTAALVLAAVATVPFFGGALLPELREGHYIVHMVAAPGTSIEESLRIGGEVTSALLRDTAVRSVAQRVGRAEEGEDTVGSNSSELEVDLHSLAGDATERAEAAIRRILAGFPGVTLALKTFLSERLEETVSGARADVVVKLFGDDLDALDNAARRTAAALAGVRGATDVQVESPPGVPQVVVRLRPERLTRFGFQPLPVLDAIRTAYQGTEVAQVYDGNKVFDVTVVLDPSARRAPERIGALMFQNTAGARLPLSELADIRSTTGRDAVLHDGARRVQMVTCNVVRRDVASFVREARSAIRGRVALPPGVELVYAGAAEAQTAARQQLLAHTALVAIAIVLLLLIALGRVRNLLLVLANVPFAVVGAVLAVFATGGIVSLGSLVGFVTLFGITTRNSLLLISHYDHLVGREKAHWDLETALRGAGERLVPILMTASATALGLLPLALGSGEAGREIEGPMAITILGGLVTSTALNLFVLPTLALRFGRFHGHREPQPRF